MPDTSIISQLMSQGKIWKGDHAHHATPEKVIPTGYPLLDVELPGGGWPVGAVTEILYPQVSMGELRLVLPALKHVAQHDQRWQIWLNPPGQPYGPGLNSWGVSLRQTLVCADLTPKEFSWVIDQSVQHSGCSVVLAWANRIEPAQLRRLQLASERRDIAIFLFRPIRKANNLPYSRLKLQIGAGSKPLHIRIDILKRRPNWPVDGIEFLVPLYGSEWP